MKVAEINDAIEHGRLRLSREERRDYYSTILAFLGFTALFLLGAADFISPMIALIITVLAITLALLALWYLYAQLKLEVVETRLSKKELDEIITSVSRSRRWRRSKQTKRCYLARTPTGARITILFQEDRIFVNSRIIGIPLNLRNLKQYPDIHTLVSVIRNHQSGY